VRRNYPPPRFLPTKLNPDEDPKRIPSQAHRWIEAESSGCSIKDSFAACDLTSHGFVELFTAQWIYRPTGLRAPASPGLRIERVATAARLRAWQTAWHGGGETEYAALFPQAEMAVQPAGGHFPWLDNPEWFVHTLAGFLR
jgi:hypothetical protein